MLPYWKADPRKNLADLVNISESNDETLHSSDGYYEENSISAEISDENSYKSNYEPESYYSSAQRRADRSSSTRQNGLRKDLPPQSKSARIEKPQSQSQWLFVLRWGVILIGAIAIGLYVYMPTKISEKKCTYDKLQLKYPVQDKKVWRTVSINIENIINRRSKKPAVYLFVHQGGKEMSTIVRDIAAETAECFGGKFSLVEMSRNDFTSSDTMQDYGYAIQIFKEKIEKRHVALIVNLNEIPPDAARALHTICDTETPIAEEIVIFLTLVTPLISGNPVKNAEDALIQLWSSKLKHNELYALITRVTDDVIALKSQ